MYRTRRTPSSVNNSAVQGIILLHRETDARRGPDAHIYESYTSNGALDEIRFLVRVVAHFLGQPVLVKDPAHRETQRRRWMHNVRNESALARASRIGIKRKGNPQIYYREINRYPVG